MRWGILKENFNKISERILKGRSAVTIKQIAATILAQRRKKRQRRKKEKRRKGTPQPLAKSVLLA